MLPSHHAFKGKQNHRGHDWLLAIGPSALGELSTEYHVPRIHADTLHRNYIVSSIDACISKYNKAVKMLEEQPTHPATFSEAKQMPFLSLVTKHQKFMFAIRKV